MYPVVLDSALGPAHSGAAPREARREENPRDTLVLLLVVVRDTQTTRKGCPRSKQASGAAP